MEEPLSTTYHIGLLVFMVIAAIGLIVLIWSTVTQRRTDEHREQILFRLGYTLASPPPPQLVTQITKLHRRQERPTPEPRNTYLHPIAGGEIYLFDLGDAGDAGAGNWATDMLAVISPALDLPRLTLLPRPGILSQNNGAGLLGQLANAALDAAASQIGLVELEYTDDPEFAENFMVLAEDESVARAFLTNRIRMQLLQWERRYIIDAVENTFTLTRSLSEQSSSLSEEGLEIVRDDAERILSLFRKHGMSYT